MPAKQNAFLDSGEVRTIFRDPTSMKYALVALQVACHDRVETTAFLRLNKTDQEKGYYRQITDQEYKSIDRIVRKMVREACRIRTEAGL